MTTPPPLPPPPLPHRPPLPPLSHGQPPAEPYNGSAAPTSHSVPMLIPLVTLFFMLVGILSIFLFRDILSYLSSTTWLSRFAGTNPREPSTTPAATAAAEPGLDPTILASFPTLPYSAVKGLQEGKCGKECPVCLAEFAAGDVIRLLTVCCHAFHPVCIDSWLAAHTTCPMCRSDLEAPPDEAAVLAVKEAVSCVAGDSHTITVEMVGEEEQKLRLPEGR